MTNEELYAAARRLMPGGVNSPVRACLRTGVAPRFVTAAKGSRIVDAEGAIYASKVALFCPKCNQGVRVKTVLEDGKKVRTCAKCGEKL